MKIGNSNPPMDVDRHGDNLARVETEGGYFRLALAYGGVHVESEAAAAERRHLTYDALEARCKLRRGLHLAGYRIRVHIGLEEVDIHGNL